MTGTSPTLLLLDTRDDRTEVWHLLHRLSPRRRVAFLGWCCSRVCGPGQTRPTVSHRMAGTVVQAYRFDDADHRLTNEVYTDCLVLAAQWNLDLSAAARELEQRVRYPHRSGRPPGPPPPPSPSRPSSAS